MLIAKEPRRSDGGHSTPKGTVYPPPLRLMDHERREDRKDVRARG